MKNPAHSRQGAFCLVALLAMAHARGAEIQSGFRSHPPIREAPSPARRAMAQGPARFVDAARGSDTNPGAHKVPWRTVNHALKRLKPGDTLYLRGGSYFENVYCAVSGLPRAPITIRSYPGEQAVIEGGLPEFQTDPASAWKPFPDGAPGEYVSAKPYKNIRDVLGMFADSNIGLVTYWHAKDLRATTDLVDYEEETIEYRGKRRRFLKKPFYCGPGVWYDRQTGRIHCRLAHTRIRNPKVANYRGETDPRKLPLVIAPFNATPLFVDLARHVRFQDLVFRGGGYKTVNLLMGVNVHFDNCTIWCGTYGVWAKNTGPLKMTHCGVYGSIPPWGFSTENALQTYTPRYYDPFLKDALALYAEGLGNLENKANGFAQYADKLRSPFARRRNVARLNTHAVLVTEGGYEFETFYYPVNHDWDISYCEFTDGHDGVYPSGRNIRFHHNWVDNMQDDGIYMSSPTPYVSHKVYIYQNLVTKTGSAFALHSRGGPNGDIYVFRNVADLRRGVQRGRPTPKNPQGDIRSLQVFLKHGRPFLGSESIFWYQNTFIAPSRHYGYVHKTYLYATDKALRRSFNNICIYMNQWPAASAVFTRARLGTSPNDILIDGNLHWTYTPKVKMDPKLVETARNCEASQRSKKTYPPGWAANDVIADPKFTAFSEDENALNDYRLRKDSPAVGKGVALPPDLPDPLRPKSGVRPDMGAIPLGADALRVGRRARIVAGYPGSSR